MLQPRDSVHGAYFNIEKGENGGLAIDKKDCFLKLRKEAVRKRLFRLNESTPLSMIVALHKAYRSSNKRK